MAKSNQSELSQKAQALAASGETTPEYLKHQNDTPNVGMRDVPRDEHATRGPLDAEAQRTVLERSRKVR